MVRTEARLQLLRLGSEGGLDHHQSTVERDPPVFTARPPALSTQSRGAAYTRLFTINHLWTRARLRDIKAAGFAIREIVTFDTPKNFPPMGFQLGAVCLSRGWTGPVTLTDYNMPPQPKDGGASARSSTLTCRLKRGKSGASQSALGLDPVLAELRALNRHLDTLLAEAVVKR